MLDHAAKLPHLSIVRGDDVLLVADGRSAGLEAITAEARSRRIPVVVTDRSVLLDFTLLDVLERRSCILLTTGPPVRC